MRMTLQRLEARLPVTWKERRSRTRHVTLRWCSLHLNLATLHMHQSFARYRPETVSIRDLRLVMHLKAVPRGESEARVRNRSLRLVTFRQNLILRRAHRLVRPVPKRTEVYIQSATNRSIQEAMRQLIAMPLLFRTPASIQPQNHHRPCLPLVVMKCSRQWISITREQVPMDDRGYLNTFRLVIDRQRRRTNAPMHICPMKQWSHRDCLVIQLRPGPLAPLTTTSLQDRTIPLDIKDLPDQVASDVPGSHGGAAEQPAASSSTAPDRSDASGDEQRKDQDSGIAAGIRERVLGSPARHQPDSPLRRKRGKHH
ncbi:unnamed protein product (mitochondrion) [Plasmodiophora brassicae]|uniref:Uncharacterized protein n=1 Tax=Plasmodiophora brassicae TaxID=37360 RepID=A0A3P3XZE4_PLABS|nr:unnamed protein product [Plasmodiophora brassicae]